MLNRVVLTEAKCDPLITICTQSVIPLVDVSQDEHVAAQAVYRACTESGFFYAVNHGIPQELLAEVFQTMRAAFAMPDDAKRAMLADENNRGCELICRIGMVCSCRQLSSPDFTQCTMGLGHTHWVGHWVSMPMQFAPICLLLSLTLRASAALPQGMPGQHTSCRTPSSAKHSSSTMLQRMFVTMNVMAC